jgi:hypothetical protein
MLRRSLRQARGCEEEPGAVAIDSQSVKAAANTQADTGGYNAKIVEHGAELGIDVEIVHRDPSTEGFRVLPRWWVVERTFGWFMLHC